VRAFLAILIPLLLPTVLYILYARFGRRDAASVGGETVPADMPWSWLLLSGGLLVLVTFFAIYLFEDRGGGGYHPAQIIDGEIKPGYFDAESN